MRLILSLLMVVAIIAGFAFFVMPTYRDIQTMRVEAKDYEEILANARKLTQERNRLMESYNAFDANRLKQLDVMLPQNPDNVKLILQLDAIASDSGSVLQNVKIEEAPAATPTTQTRAAGQAPANPNIGTLGVNFTVVGPYLGFTDFIRRLETSLRIIDVQKISFASADDRTNYQYTVGIKSYWLK